MAAGIAFGAAGCASYSGSGLAPGKATAAETRAQMGAPAAVHRAATGAPFVESWEYPRGPMGRHTYMARFDSRGVLVAIDQVLSVENAARIRIGQDGRDEVRRLLGRPGMVYPLRGGGESWDYAAFASDGQSRRIRIVVEFDARGVAIAAGENLDPEEQGGTLGAIAL